MGSLRTIHLSPCTPHAAFAATHVATSAPLSSAVFAVSFLSVVCARMAAAVPLDPRFEFTFENGAPTVGNLNAAGGDLFCTVAPVHFLHVASGGTLEPSLVSPGRFRVRWTDVWIALLKVCTIDPALQGTLVSSRICSARAMHDLFALCSAGGLSFAAVGSPSAAMAVFVRTGRPLAQESPSQWIIGAAMLQALPATPAAVANALPVECQWFMALCFGMCSNASGSALALAASLSILPGWCSHVSRALATFQDASTEFDDMVGESRPGWAATNDRRRALAISSYIGQRLQSFELVLPVPPAFAFASVSLYRLSKPDAYPSFFEWGWRSAYDSLSDLFGPICDGPEALRLCGRLLSAAPSADPISSLNSRVRLLLPHLDTAVLRAASAEKRANAMDALLRSSISSGGGSSAQNLSASATGSGSDEKDTVMWGRIFSQPQTKALFLLLDPLNVVPLVEYRVARVLLGDVSPIGVHVIAKGVKVPSTLFRSVKAGFSHAAALVALQRTLCVNATNTLMLDWFSAFDLSSLVKLVTGKWSIGPSSPTHFDVWGELVARLYVFQKGPHSLGQITNPSPTAFFSSEFALRVGSPILVSVWAFVGVTGAASLVGSVAWTLAELHARAAALACWPIAFAESQRACLRLLEQAGSRAFSDASIAWGLMLEAPVELSVKPTLLCPPSSGFHSILVRCDAIISRTDVEILVENDKAQGRLSPPPAPSSRPSSPGARSLAALSSPPPRPPSPAASHISAGPSISQVGFAPPASAVGSQHGPFSSIASVSGWKAPSLQAHPEENGFWCGQVWGGPLSGNRLSGSVCRGAYCQDPYPSHIVLHERRPPVSARRPASGSNCLW